VPEAGAALIRPSANQQELVLRPRSPLPPSSVDVDLGSAAGLGRVVCGVRLGCRRLRRSQPPGWFRAGQPGRLAGGGGVRAVVWPPWAVPWNNYLKQL